MSCKPSKHLTAYDDFFRGMTNAWRLFIPFYAKLPTKANAEFYNSMKGLDDLVYSLIEQSINKQNNKNAARNSLLDILIDSCGDTATGLDKKELHDNIIVLFLAGHETSSSSLSYTCYELAKNPLVQEQVFQEIVSVFGTKNPTSYEKISECRLLGASLKEALRMHPPIASIPPRMLDEQQTLDDFVIPANVCQTFCSHYNRLLCVSMSMPFTMTKSFGKIHLNSDPNVSSMMKPKQDPHMPIYHLVAVLVCALATTFPLWNKKCSSLCFCKSIVWNWIHWTLNMPRVVLCDLQKTILSNWCQENKKSFGAKMYPTNAEQWTQIFANKKNIKLKYVPDHSWLALFSLRNDAQYGQMALCNLQACKVSLIEPILCSEQPILSLGSIQFLLLGQVFNLSNDAGDQIYQTLSHYLFHMDEYACNMEYVESTLRLLMMLLKKYENQPQALRIDSKEAENLLQVVRSIVSQNITDKVLDSAISIHMQLQQRMPALDGNLVAQAFYDWYDLIPKYNQNIAACMIRVIQSTSLKDDVVSKWMHKAIHDIDKNSLKQTAEPFSGVASAILNKYEHLPLNESDQLLIVSLAFASDIYYMNYADSLRSILKKTPQFPSVVEEILFITDHVMTTKELDLVCAIALIVSFTPLTARIIDNYLYSKHNYGSIDSYNGVAALIIISQNTIMNYELMHRFMAIQLKFVENDSFRQYHENILYESQH